MGKRNITCYLSHPEHRSKNCMNVNGDCLGKGTDGKKRMKGDGRWWAIIIKELYVYV
jgi:hypothetical protein